MIKIQIVRTTPFWEHLTSDQSKRVRSKTQNSKNRISDPRNRISDPWTDGAEGVPSSERTAQPTDTCTENRNLSTCDTRHQNRPQSPLWYQNRPQSPLWSESRRVPNGQLVLVFEKQLAFPQPPLTHQAPSPWFRRTFVGACVRPAMCVNLTSVLSSKLHTCATGTPQGLRLGPVVAPSQSAQQFSWFPWTIHYCLWL